MIKTMRRYFSCLIIAILCISTVCVPSFAMDNTVPNDTTNAVYAANATIPFSEGGILKNNSVKYTITIPEDGTYTVTLSTRQIQGSNGVWMMLDKANVKNIIDTNVNGSYQKRVNLTAGTYYLELYASGTYSYAVSIYKPIA